MENQQQSQPIQPQGTQIPTPQTPQNWKEKIKKAFDRQSKSTKNLIIIASVLFAIIFILLIFSVIFGKKKTNVVIATPSPTPLSGSPAPDVILNASRYATDSGVLKIETDLKDFEKQLDTVDIRQSDLTLPNLDYNINFNQ